VRSRGGELGGAFYARFELADLADRLADNTGNEELP
jgi:hypothetical protein